MTGKMLEKMCPFFIVSGVDQSIAFYREKLGFETWHQQPEDEPFFAIVGRDGAMLLIKAGEAKPLPNPKRDPSMRWDSYVLVNDPDALAAEFVDRGVAFSVPLRDTEDGLRGFEIADPDGYVLFSGGPGRASGAGAIERRFPSGMTTKRALGHLRQAKAMPFQSTNLLGTS